MTERGRVRVERAAKRVRVYLGGQVVADTRRPWLVWERPNYPYYYFPREDVRSELLVDTGERKRSPSRGDAHLYTVRVGDAVAASAAYTYPDSPIPELRDAFAFRWHAMDHWFEEDEEVYVHPRDPYTRVDILHSSRRVRVELDGVTLAETQRPTLLFETGLPTRYYLAKTDVRMDLLTPTDHRTECPYKGVAEYWSATVNGTVYENLVWSYPFPSLESVKIAGLVAFYNEKTDIYVDGELEERPRTAFS